jgi:hypothetical protein
VIRRCEVKDGSEGRDPQRRRRSPDSIWERYLTGKLSLEDKETLPALIKELHREIAQHLGHKVDADNPAEVEPHDIDLPTMPPPMLESAPIINLNVCRSHIPKRRRIDPRRN